ncbi:SDR family oxidoreductase [Patescibacteria group bacterium]|nr:SDR family oxidoreductase [Patescibacteria group bacterium]
MKIEKIFSLKNQVVIITGGAGMLGQEYANTLSVIGAKVILLDIKNKPVNKKIAYFKINITKKDEVAKTVKKIIKKFKRIDVLINNAALNPVPNTKESSQQFSCYENYPIKLWEKEISVGLTGMLICSQAVIPIMKKQKKGVIINICSTYGIVAPDNRIYDKGKYKSIAYATVKGAVPNFSRSLSSYLRNTGVRVNTLTLGGVFAGHKKDFVKKYSDRTILNRMAKKDEYNGAIIFLASDASSYMTGTNLIIDGGWTAW